MCCISAHSALLLMLRLQVVSIHNTVNEQSWRKVLEYESMHASSCPQGPKLVRFRGRPADLSPKARMLSWIGSANYRHIMC